MKSQKVSLLYLVLLILAGESVFILPFIIPRVFRPTVLECFSLSNVDLGLCYSSYGIVALFSYLLGGPIADRYSPRKLISISLVFTALGGIYFASFPSLLGLQTLYAYWGFTTIFLFWAPMIKATRIWGGKLAQGKAFGFLDGGRGMVGALFSSLGVFIYSMLSSEGNLEDNITSNQDAFAPVIFTSSLLVALVGVLVWFFLKMKHNRTGEINVEKISIQNIKKVLSLSSIWLLMIIILCAYVGYKITDVFSLYANEVMLYDEVESAKVGTYLLYIRPVIGIIIGILADRSKITLFLLVSFVCAFLGAVSFAVGIVNASATLFFIFSTLLVAIGVYGARSLYFAVLRNGKIPLALTGTAVGMISIVGYTPDIFAGPFMGWLLDSSPGIEGHQNVFWMLAGFSFIGMLASVVYYKIYER